MLVLSVFCFCWTTPTHAGWTNIGPYVVSSISSLAINPSNPQIIYAGASGGGVFKSTNGGASWNPINSGLPADLANTTISCIAINPSNPQIIYAGTDGNGIFKSTNGGASWKNVFSPGAEFSINFLTIAPKAPQTIYAGTYAGGLYKSTNGGANWKAVSSGLPSSPTVWSLAIDPKTPTTLYAGAATAIVDTDGTPGGVYKSTNGGASWVFSGLPVTNSTISSLAINPSNPKTIYAGVLSDGDVYKSTNGGESWTKVNSGSRMITCLAINTKNPQIIYAGSYSGVYKSTNGGTSWTKVNSGLTHTGINSIAINPLNPEIICAGGNGVYKSTNGATSWTPVNSGLLTAISNTSLAINPLNPQIIYAGGAGVYKSTNGGTSWTEADSGLALTWFAPLAINPSNPQIVYAVGDVVYKSTNGGASWKAANSGLPSSASVASLAINPTTPTTLYAAGSYQDSNSTDFALVYKSTNGGTSWTALKNSGLPSKYAFVTSLAIDPTTPTTLYAGTDASYPDGVYGVYKSTDGGESWKAVNFGLPSSANIASLAINSKTPTTLYAAGSYQDSNWNNCALLYMSTNGGTSWTEVNSGIPSSATNADSLAINPRTPTTLYAVTSYNDSEGNFVSGGVYMSNNGGTNWTEVNSGLPSSAGVTCLAINPKTPATIYAGTDSGVYETTNGGLANDDLIDNPNREFDLTE
jgi:photosystem II stability/assembly factor-like uncharacterized protein